MDIELILKLFIVYLIVSGLIKTTIVTFLYIVGSQDWGERHVKTMSNWGGFFDVTLISGVYLAGFFNQYPQMVSFGDLLNIHSEFIFYTDQVSLAYLFVSTLVLGLVGRFSCFYLHKDKYYYKFFSLFYVFQSATVLLILSDNFASYFIGWELLGISSVLLISFYSERKGPVKNSLRIFTLYKISDILLFSGFAAAYSHAHLQLFSEFSTLNADLSSAYMILTSLAIMIKMGGLPVIWLPRAMEGPTPSSAVFYGSLATHIPLLLFIKLWSGAETHLWVKLVLFALLFGIISFATLFSRVQADAKNALAYATVKHIAIISIEVIFGFIYLAYIHTILHCFYRLFQFIRTPSLIYEFHQAEGYHGNGFADGGKHYGYILPNKLQNWIYRLSLREFYIFPRLFRLIDILMGLTNNLSRRKLRVILLFNLIMFIFLISFEWLEIHEINSSLLLLMPAWFFSLIALLINYHDWRYVYTTALSIVSLGSVVLYVDGFLSLTWILSIQFILLFILILSFSKIMTRHQKYQITPKSKLILFVLALWLVGVPGPGTYYIFEKTIHLSMEYDMYFSIGAFIVLSINTLAVVKHYSLDCLPVRRTIK